MRIVREAMAGTLESSDVLVRVAPADTLQIDIKSSVLAQFGAQIRAVVTEQLDHLGVTGGLIAVDDKGALDFAIRARVQAAVLRACDERPDWRTL